MTDRRLRIIDALKPFGWSVEDPKDEFWHRYLVDPWVHNLANAVAVIHDRERIEGFRADIAEATRLGSPMTEQRPHVAETVTASDGEPSIVVHSDPRFLYDLGTIAAAERDALRARPRALYEVELDDRLAEAEALLRLACEHLPGDSPLDRRIDAFLAEHEGDK